MLRKPIRNYFRIMYNENYFIIWESEMRDIFSVLGSLSWEASALNVGLRITYIERTEKEWVNLW